jgi:hypothetical protein
MPEPVIPISHHCNIPVGNSILISISKTVLKKIQQLHGGFCGPNYNRRLSEEG